MLTCSKCETPIEPSARGRRRYCDACRRAAQLETKAAYHRRTYALAGWAGDLDGEVWKPWPTEPAYEVSNLGRVRSYKARDQRRMDPLLMSPSVAANGRHSINVRIGDGNQRKALGALVLEAFVGSRPTPDHMALHYDDDPWNNHIDNLRWGTSKENAADKKRNGWSAVRTARPRAHFTAKQVRAIRELGHQTNHVQLAEALGVGVQTLENLLSRRSYADVE